MILLLYLTCKLKERIDVNQDGPVWLLKLPSPPPPPGPQIAKDANVFHIWKTYYLLFFFVVVMSPVWWGLHDTLIPLHSTYGSPGPPKTNFHHITSIFYRLLEDNVGVKSISKFSRGLEAYIKNVYDFCWPMYTDLGRPGDTFAVAGDRTI